MEFAVNAGLVPFNPCQKVRKTFAIGITKHMPTLEPHELSRLLTAIRTAGIEIGTRCLLLWSLHTLARPNEAARVRWDEIDLVAGIWAIPAAKMKGGKARKEQGAPHRIPLTKQTKDLLETMRPISGRCEYLFPGRNNPKTGH